jgi:hypothetical protein
MKTLQAAQRAMSGTHGMLTGSPWDKRGTGSLRSIWHARRSWRVSKLYYMVFTKAETTIYNSLVDDPTMTVDGVERHQQS